MHERSDGGVNKKSRQEGRDGSAYERVSVICAEVKEFACKMVSGLKEKYAAVPSSDRCPLFGCTKQSLPQRRYLTAPSYATTPWMRGCPPLKQELTPAGDKVRSMMVSKTADELAQCVNLFLSKN